MPKANAPAVVQEYIANPHLINGKKYDCRIYIGVTSFDPLRAYLYDEVGVRAPMARRHAVAVLPSMRPRRAHQCALAFHDRSHAM